MQDYYNYYSIKSSFKIQLTTFIINIIIIIIIIIILFLKPLI